MGSQYGKKAYVNGLLIALNVLFFLYLEITGSSEDAYFMYTKGAMYAPAVLEDGEYYRLLTAMFMHFGIRHIMNNMLVLFVLGDNLERALGHVKYLIFYLLCGIGSNWVSMMAHTADTMTFFEKNYLSLLKIIDKRDNILAIILYHRPKGDRWPNGGII